MAPVGELAEAGVSRISVGGAFAFAAYGAAATAGRELLESGTYGYWETAAGEQKPPSKPFIAEVANATGGRDSNPDNQLRGWRLAIRRPPNEEVEDIY